MTGHSDIQVRVITLIDLDKISSGWTNIVRSVFAFLLSCDYHERLS